jgi:hypothetical protein
MSFLRPRSDPAEFALLRILVLREILVHGLPTKVPRRSRWHGPAGSVPYHVISSLLFCCNHQPNRPGLGTMSCPYGDHKSFILVILTLHTDCRFISARPKKAPSSCLLIKMRHRRPRSLCSILYSTRTIWRKRPFHWCRCSPSRLHVAV